MTKLSLNTKSLRQAKLERLACSACSLACLMAADKVLTLPAVKFKLRERGTIAGMLFKLIQDDKARIRFVRTLARLCYK